MMHHIRTTLSAIILITLGSIAARAQGDLRLSMDEPVTSIIPADAVVQAAASIGSTTLAVWGTGAREADGVMVPELVLQIVRGGAVVGVPRPVHAQQARPYRFVAVVPAASSFLVIWNDRRVSAPGIYARRLDGDGNPLGEETRISEGAILPNGVLPFRALGIPSRGQTLVWSDDRERAPGIYAITLDAGGIFTSSERYLGASLISIDRTAPDPVLNLVVDSRGYVIRDDGRIEERTIPRTSMIGDYMDDVLSSLPRWVVIDSSLEMASLMGRAVRLFHSAFDTTSYAAVNIPWAISYPTILVKVRDGLYKIITVRKTTTDRTEELTVHTALIDSLGLHDEKDEHTGKFYATTPPRNGYTYLQYGGWNIVRYCGSRYSVEIKVTNRYGSPSYGDFTSDSFFSFGIGDSGKVVGKGEVVNTGCMRSDIVSIRRVRADSMSVVAIHSDSIELAAAVAPGARYEDQLAPMVAWAADGPAVAWRNRAPAVTLVGMSAVTGSLRTLDSADPLTYRPSLPPERFAASRLIMSNIQTPNGFPNDVRFHSYRLADEGWIHSHVQVENRQLGMYYYERAVGYDPNRGLLTVVHDRTGYIHENGIALLLRKGTRIFTIDTACRIIFNDTASHPLELTGRSLIPLRDGKLLVADDTSAVLIDGVDSVKRITLPRGGPGLFYQRMLGEAFLRVYYADESRTEVVVERYDLDARPLQERRLTFNAPRRDLFVAQSPLDSSIILITAADGVHATALGSDLGLLVPDAVISATRGPVGHPTGAIRGDSLFVAWEDYRSTATDIYGRSVPMALLRKSAVAVSPEPSPALLAPNPASTRVMVELPRPASSPASLAIFDAAGGEVRRVQVDAPHGEHEEIDLEGLAGGVYMVRVISASGVTAGKLVVVR